MKRTVCLSILLFFIMLSVGCNNQNPTGESNSKQVTDQYFLTLDKWVESGGPTNEIQNTVVNTCGKLVMITSSNMERVSLSTTQRDEFNGRVDVCVKITVNRVYPQDDFKNKEIVEMICDKSDVSLFKNMCKRYGLR